MHEDQKFSNDNVGDNRKTIFEKPNLIKSEYILGPGDNLLINFEIIYFSRSYMLTEGILVLPEINKFYAAGMTLDKLEIELIEAYKKSIINPKINISVIQYRPVSVFITGK